MGRFLLCVSILLTIASLSIAYRITGGQFDLVWDEWGYDGYYLTYNATGEVFYETPTSNAFCKDISVYYSGNSTTNCSIWQDWFCRGWLQQGMPADFQIRNRAGQIISLATTTGQVSFYPGEQLHWDHNNIQDIFQSGGVSGGGSVGRMCVETVGTAPYRRLLFTWDGVQVSGGFLHTNQIKFFETTNVLEFVLKDWVANQSPRVGFEGNWVISGSNVYPPGNYSGFAARYLPAQLPPACPATSNGWPAMRCVSETRFTTCSNGRWYSPQSCQPGTYCNPDGDQIYCGFTNPLGATTTTTSATATTTTSTTAAVTSSRVTSGPVTSRGLTTNPITSGAAPVTTAAAPITSGKLTTNNVNGAQLVIESPGLYHVSVSTQGANDYWIDTASYLYGQTQTLTMSWGPEQFKPYQKVDGQYDDPNDPTVTHLWTTLTSVNDTVNFFPSNDQIPLAHHKWTGAGNARWRTESLYLGSDFYLLGTSLKVWDSQGNLRGQGGLTGLNMFFDWPDVGYPQIDTFAPINYTGNPINSKVTFEILARRANNPPLTTGNSIIVTTRGLTTNTASTACSVGQTRCNGAQYQTCVYTYSSGGWVGGWGGNQNCAPGTTCHQLGTDPFTWISCY